MDFSSVDIGGLDSDDSSDVQSPLGVRPPEGVPLLPSLYHDFSVLNAITGAQGRDWNEEWQLLCEMPVESLLCLERRHAKLQALASEFATASRGCVLTLIHGKPGLRSVSHGVWAQGGIIFSELLSLRGFSDAFGSAQAAAAMPNREMSAIAEIMRIAPHLTSRVSLPLVAAVRVVHRVFWCYAPLPFGRTAPAPTPCKATRPSPPPSRGSAPAPDPADQPASRPQEAVGRALRLVQALRDVAGQPRRRQRGAQNLTAAASAAGLASPRGQRTLSRKGGAAAAEGSARMPGRSSYADADEGDDGCGGGGSSQPGDVVLHSVARVLRSPPEEEGGRGSIHWEGEGNPQSKCVLNEISTYFGQTPEKRRLKVVAPLSVKMVHCGFDNRIYLYDVARFLPADGVPRKGDACLLQGTTKTVRPEILHHLQRPDFIPESSSPYSSALGVGGSNYTTVLSFVDAQIPSLSFPKGVSISGTLHAAGISLRHLGRACHQDVSNSDLFFECACRSLKSLLRHSIGVQQGSMDVHPSYADVTQSTLLFLDDRSRNPAAEAFWSEEIHLEMSKKFPSVADLRLLYLGAEAEGLVEPEGEVELKLASQLSHSGGRVNRGLLQRMLRACATEAFFTGKRRELRFRTTVTLKELAVRRCRSNEAELLALCEKRGIDTPSIAVHLLELAQIMRWQKQREEVGFLSRLVYVMGRSEDPCDRPAQHRAVALYASALLQWDNESLPLRKVCLPETLDFSPRKMPQIDHLEPSDATIAARIELANSRSTAPAERHLLFEGVVRYFEANQSRALLPCLLQHALLMLEHLAVARCAMCKAKAVLACPQCHGVGGQQTQGSHHQGRHKASSAKREVDPGEVPWLPGCALFCEGCHAERCGASEETFLWHRSEGAQQHRTVEVDRPCVEVLKRFLAHRRSRRFSTLQGDPQVIQAKLSLSRLCHNVNLMEEAIKGWHSDVPDRMKAVQELVVLRKGGGGGDAAWQEHTNRLAWEHLEELLQACEWDTPQATEHKWCVAYICFLTGALMDGAGLVMLQNLAHLYGHPSPCVDAEAASGNPASTFVPVRDEACKLPPFEEVAVVVALVLERLGAALLEMYTPGVSLPRTTALHAAADRLVPAFYKLLECDDPNKRLRPVLGLLTDVISKLQGTGTEIDQYKAEMIIMVVNAELQNFKKSGASTGWAAAKALKPQVISGSAWTGEAFVQRKRLKQKRKVNSLLRRYKLHSDVTMTKAGREHTVHTTDVYSEKLSRAIANMQEKPQPHPPEAHPPSNSRIADVAPARSRGAVAVYAVVTPREPVEAPPRVTPRPKVQPGRESVSRKKAARRRVAPTGFAMHYHEGLV